MKFHNQKSFMGHEISNVKNKPLLHKKGKQWIVVAISALVLAGFGGMVSTTTHADATAQPTTTKVAPKPANNSGNASNVMKQAQGMHKVLTNNAAVQKPSAPSSAVAKKTTPASATSTTSAKSNSVSASSSVSSKASSSVNSASVKSSSASSNSNSSNNKATKPAVHMMLMSTPATATKTGTWGTARYIFSHGNLKLFGGHNAHISDGKLPAGLHTSDITSISTSPDSPVTYYLEGNMGQFANAYQTANAQSDTNGTGFGSSAHFKNLQSIDFSGMDFEHKPDATLAQLFDPRTQGGGGGAYYPSMKAMFAGDTKLSTVKGLHVSPATHLVDMSGMFADCPSLSNLDLSHVYTPYLAFIGNAFHGDTNLQSVNMSHIDTSDTTGKSSSNPNWGFENMFTGDTNLQSINLGPKTILNGDTGIAAKNDWIQVNNNSAKLITSNGVNNSGFSTGSWQPTEDSGTWGTTSWGIDNNGDLVLQGGQITNNKVDAKDNNHNELDWSKVQHIYTNNVQAPADMTYTFANNPSGTMSYNSDTFPVESIDLSGMKINNDTTTNTTNMYGLFNNDRNLKSITWPTSMNTSNVQNMGWMFAGDYALTNLTLPSKFNTTNANMSDMFDSDTNLQTLSLPDKFQNRKNSTDVFGYGGSNQVPSLEKLTLKPSTYLGTNANLPYNDWTQETNSKNITTPSYNMTNCTPTSALESSGNHFGTWHPIVHDTVTYQYKGSDVPPQSNYDPTTEYEPFGIKDTKDNNIDWTNYNGGQLANHMPTNWNVVDDQNQIENPTLHFNYDGGTHYVSIVPNQASSNIRLVLNNTEGPLIQSDNYSGQIHGVTYPSKYSNDSKFTVSIPAGYTLNNSNSDTSFGYGDGPHTIVLKPIINTDTINYQYKGTTLASHQFSGNNYRATKAGNNSVDITSTNEAGIPNGYHLVNKDNSFGYDGSTRNVAIEPNTATDTIYYQYNKSTVSSSTFTGNSVAASGASDTSFKVTKAPSDYHLVNANKSYNYDGNKHYVAVLPNSINIHFITKDSASNSDVVLVANNVNIENCNNIQSQELFKYVDVPVGYTPTLSNHKPEIIPSDASTYNVNVTPVSASADIDYQYNGNTIASTEASGSYGTSSSISSNSFSVAGWHLANDGTQDFEFNNASGASANGSVDVNVLPNSATDTINYQYNGQTLASQPFSGNDYRASQAGDNSVDVTANNDSDIPNGYELVNSNNNFSFNNGTYDVAIQPIPQPASLAPSVPFIPSSITPASSSVSSASSVASAPASLSVIPTSKASNEAKPTHYRYAKVITPLQLHTSKHFTDKNGVLVIKHPTEFRIMKIVHDHKYTRYEVKYQGHKYFITGNSKFTINDYVQKHDFKSHKHMMVRVITPLIEYKHAHFSRKYAIRVFKKGAVLPVKKVLTIGKGEMTRFELTNGRYVTSNKLFVKVIK